MGLSNIAAPRALTNGRAEARAPRWADIDRINASLDSLPD
jgi:hypothetical protein